VAAPDIAPGQWVQFEALLNYFVVNGHGDAAEG
jgi:hypothetical protein